MANKKKGPFSPIDQYADYLGALEGKEFQDHVCFRLGRRYTYSLMVDRVLPPWGSDPLSTFLRNAQFNEHALAVNAADLYTLLQHVHGTFEQVAGVTEKENNEHLIPTRLLMARAHAAWLAAVRLGMSGQVVETYPLVRVIVENAWYALHLAKDPAAPSRAEVWLRRSEDDGAEKRCATEFSIRNVRTTHAALDIANEAALYEVYKRTIAFGGHPNERGVLSATARTDTGGTYTYAVSQLPTSRSSLRRR